MSVSEIHILDPEGGGNQSGLRDKNARVVLSYIRRHGAMPSAEIARRSGLSAQTVSNITRALEADGLVRRGKAIKGKVGKPSVPVELNPSGVHAFGLNIGRRSAELVLVDFGGTPLQTLTMAYGYPTIDGVLRFLTDGIATIFADHPNARSSVSAIGVASPSKLWEWLEVVDAPKEAMQMWQDLDICAAIEELTGFDVFLENDATSACVAEHLLGRGNEFSDFAYIFIGAFVGGGLVLNSKVFSGRTGNAAAFGPMPVPDGKGGTTELLNVASLHVLEKSLSDAGIEPLLLRTHIADWGRYEDHVAPWIESTSRSLAIAAASITSIVEVEAILIDGAMPAEVCERLTAATQRAFAALDLTIIKCPVIEQARVGKGARSLGAALLPIHARYFLA